MKHAGLDTVLPFVMCICIHVPQTVALYLIGKKDHPLSLKVSTPITCILKKSVKTPDIKTLALIFKGSMQTVKLSKDFFRTLSHTRVFLDFPSGYEKLDTSRIELQPAPSSLKAHFYRAPNVH